jgi:crotonobetainyl-CoA:carnitine CoA-transferase CaiB-like acyl-CoA transferase
MKVPAPPIHLSSSDVSLQPAPLLGQHTVEVLSGELALPTSEIERLEAARVVASGISVSSAAAV